MKFIILSLFSFYSYALEPIASNKRPFYAQVFSTIEQFKSIKVPDPISDKPINTKILKAYDKDKKLLGYIREVSTTTGCKSACLPVIFTLFYDSHKTLIKMLSKPGLTKKFHAPFTDKDYEKMEWILTINPKVFKKVLHPTEMVDAITGATKKEYRDDVIKDAAYTSLRVNLYNQQTIKELKKLK